MKIDRKEANPVEVFIPFVLQITIEKREDVEIFVSMLNAAGENGDNHIADLCDDLMQMF